jgi:hypothetical protein
LPLTLLLVSVCATSSVRAAESEAIEGPVAVLALLSDTDRDVLIRLAEAVQKELAASGRIEVLPADRVATLLGSGGPTLSSKENLDRLAGLFQQGYLQSYSFEYRKAKATLDRVLEGLERLPADPARWELWVKAMIFEGISLAGLQDEAGALRSFATVLRTRTTMVLSPQEYSPKTIALWEKARLRLDGLAKGQLAVQSDPPGAQVLLDGNLVGQTPYIGSFSFGQYHLQVVHGKHGGAVRWIRIESEPTRIRFQLSFEGALLLDQTQPGVLLPAGQDRLPDPWWPWLGDRLGLRFLVAVRRTSEDGRPYLAAALVDLERGHRIREGSVELASSEPAQLQQYAAELSAFMITGKAVPRIRIQRDQPQPAPEPVGQRMPELPVTFKPRPWYRHWWPYAAAAGTALALGTGSQLAADYYRRQADQATSVSRRDSARHKADGWQAAAITGFSLAGAAAITGLVLYLTYEPEEVFGKAALVPLLNDDRGIGLAWVGWY